FLGGRPPARGGARARPPPQLPFPCWPRLIEYIAAVGNDLEPPAVGLAPVIAEVKAALTAAPGCRVAQMSGSGPTCFGLFEDAARAAAGADALRQARPQWWIVATALEGVARPPSSGTAQALRRGPGPQAAYWDTSSRPLRIAGNTASTMVISDSNSRPPLNGRSTKVMKLPREITSAWRSFSSISRPSTKPSRSGAGSKPNFMTA